MENMDKIFTDIRNTAKSAVKKSGDMIEITKLKMNVADIQTSIKTKFEFLGEAVYKEAKGKAEDVDTERVVYDIDELYDELEQLKLKIADLKNEKVCSNCGKANPDGNLFCSACGSEFDD